MGNSEHKPKGWHSRRHETRAAQDAAREAYERRAEGRPKQKFVGGEAVADGGHWVKVP